MYKVLYIEDEQDPREDLPPILKEWDVELVPEKSIPDALSLFSKQDFDAVLLDICMPPSDDMEPEAVAFGRETGVEVARRLKKIKPDVPIVALTVVNDRDIMARMREAGICEIRNKPEDPYPVAEVIVRAIKAGKQ